MEPKDYIALFGVAAGLLAFIVGLFQYRKAQTWKRLEFVASEIRSAFSDPQVQLATQLLDWNLSTYDLRRRDEERDLIEVWIGDPQIQRAMLPHPDRSDGFSVVEIRIRSAFDSFFEVLRRFEHFVQVGLVEEEDLRPYLRYWLERLCTPSAHGKSPEVLHAIWRYIDFYDYQEVERFVARFGYDHSKLLGPVPPRPTPLP